MPSVYLAGPDVFYADARKVGNELNAMCAQAGLEGLFPLDNEIPKDTQDLARVIFEKNREMIERCDGVVANISPFRGPNMDPGTSWEIGYAMALAKPVWVYTTANGNMADRVTDLGGFEKVENFGMPENLMICIPAKRPFYDTPEQAIAAAAKHFGA